LPFRLNAFRFKSHDAFVPWLKHFNVDQREAIREVLLVTWMGKCMMEGESYLPKPLKGVFPIESLPGLRCVTLEARGKSGMRGCVKDGCNGREDHCNEDVLNKDGFKEWLLENIPRAEVTFSRVVTEASC
jgi:hypothetical protein